jgi:hypothetical protein
MPQEANLDRHNKLKKLTIILTAYLQVLQYTEASLENIQIQKDKEDG